MGGRGSTMNYHGVSGGQGRRRRPPPEPVPHVVGSYLWEQGATAMPLDVPAAIGRPPALPAPPAIPGPAFDAPVQEVIAPPAPQRPGSHHRLERAPQHLASLGEPGPHHLVVVGYDDADRRFAHEAVSARPDGAGRAVTSTSGLAGKTASTRNPPPGAGPVRSVPPTASARSRIPGSPCPPPAVSAAPRASPSGVSGRPCPEAAGGGTRPAGRRPACPA